jgi:hypothetical protein
MNPMLSHDIRPRTKALVISRALYASLSTLLVIAAYFSNAIRSADFDPQQMRTYVERTIRYGGTFYENGLHNKGPLDPIIYRFAFTLGGYEAFWYAISGFIAVGTILIAYAAYKSSNEFNTPRSLGLAVASIAFFHFALTKADYSGVLYSRNEVSYLLATTWVFVLFKRAWSSETNCRRSTIVLGIILGLAVQTVLTTIFAAAAIIFVWVSLMTAKFDFSIVRKWFFRFIISSFATFISAPLWYLARGKFSEFWGGWWIYARYQSDATGRSLGNQFGWGWDNITQYYGDWPLSLGIVFASVAMIWLHWRSMSHRQKTLYLGAIFWLVGGWLELILSQRYSTHYFIVIALPTMLLASLLVGHLFQWASQVRTIPLQRTFPILAICASLIYFPNNSVRSGLEQFSNFQGIANVSEQRRNGEAGDTRTLRAILDVVSADNDALLAWTGWPWTYLNVQRVSASRMIWSSMFLGEIYLAGSGPEWIVPHTWEWFAKDMHQSNPAAYTERNDFPRREGIPFDNFVNQNMTLKFSGSQEKVGLRNDIATLLSQVSVDSNTEIPSSNTISLGSGWCKSYAFTTDTTVGNLKLNVNFVDEPDNPLAHVIEIQSNEVRTKDHDLIFDQTKILDSSQLHAIQIIVGNRSALLTIDGEIVGAHRLEASSAPNVTVETADQNLKLSPVRSAGITWPSGCSNS